MAYSESGWKSNGSRHCVWEALENIGTQSLEANRNFFYTQFVCLTGLVILCRVYFSLKIKFYMNFMQGISKRIVFVNGKGK